MTFTLKDWTVGEVVTSTELDRIETGVDDAHNLEVKGSTEVASVALSGSLADIATVSLTIPADWGGYEIEAHATYVIGPPGSEETSIFATWSTLISIAGVAQQQQDVDINGTTSLKYQLPGAVGGRRTGMTATGSVDVKLRASGSDSIRDVYLHARAVRTA